MIHRDEHVGVTVLPRPAESLNYKYFNRLPNTAMSFTVAKIFSVSISGPRCVPCSTTSPFADVLKKEIFSRTLTINLP